VEALASWCQPLVVVLVSDSGCLIGIDSHARAWSLTLPGEAAFADARRRPDRCRVIGRNLR